MVKMNPDVNFHATGIQTIAKSGDCHGVSIPAFCMALHEGTGMPADKNNARRPSTPSGELWRPT
jgi:hypothetical protein